MVLHDVGNAPYSLDDGLGTRVVCHDAARGAIDVLTVAPALSQTNAEPLIRARAALVADLPASILAPVHDVAMGDDGAVRVTAAVSDGGRLSTILAQLVDGSLTLSDDAALQLMTRVIRAVAAVHAAPGHLAHGAITPAHVVLTQSSVVLTDGAFGPALQALEWSREQMWRTFRIALPSAASLVRFDQRTDVCQLGAIVLAIALRRPLAVDEYPRAASDLVAAATDKARGGSALRMWLQQALQLHPRATFASAIDAEQAFTELLAAATGKRTVTKRTVVRAIQRAS